MCNQLRINKTNLKSVVIEGLFNKKNVELNFDNSVKILMAENGSGKTSILDIISGVLNGNLFSIIDIPFEKVNFKLIDEEISFLKTELFKENIDWPYFRRRSQTIIRSREPNKYMKLRNLLIRNINEPYKIFKIFKTELKKETFNRILKLYNSLSDSSIITEEEDNETFLKLDRLREKIGLELEYLPTYRRIEKEFEFLGEESNRNNYSLKIGIGEENSIEENYREENQKDNINFGMEDVKVLIESYERKVREKTISGFYEMNDNILFDLLDENIMVNEEEEKKLMENPKINLILERIANDSKKDKVKVNIRRIKELIGNSIEGIRENAKERFIKYYLFKIFNIYKETEKIEASINDFKDICNKYLINKKINYSEKEIKVQINDEVGQNLDFSELSSGEKQIVSLFAKLYLSNKDNLMIIIDEPELSISVRWQKMILPDIMNSGKCELLLVTTHSPFIFNNELNDYAVDLNDYTKLINKGSN